MSLLADYSLLRPTVAQLKAAGITAVGRYIGWDSVPGYSSIGKNLTRAEAQGLIAAGQHIFLAFEYAPDAAVKGASQGSADGELASAQLADLGAPLTMGVYYACDWDVPDYAPALPDTPANAAAKLGPVASYFRAIHALKPAHLVNGYGGYYVIKRLLDAGLIAMGWQTTAWSGGRRDPRAVIYQTGAVTLGGAADVDVHEATSADFGQWPRPPAPAPAPAPAPPKGAEVPGIWKSLISVTPVFTGTVITGWVAAGIGEDGALWTTTKTGKTWSPAVRLDTVDIKP